MKQARIIRGIPFLAILVGFGCASSQGLSRDALQDVIVQEESRFLGTIPTVSASTPSKPPRLGLYLKPTGFMNREFEWSGRDRDTVLAWFQKLPFDAGGKSAGFLTLSSLKGHSLTELRTAATRYGIDWVLLFDGAAAVDRYNNYKAGLLYWTLLGAYLADGTHSDALCVLKATLWDVKTGARLFEEQADGKAEKVGPAALVDDNAVVELAKARALEELTRRLDKQFHRLREFGKIQ